MTTIINVRQGTDICTTFIMGKEIVSDNISKQVPNNASKCCEKEKIAHHPLMVNILPFIIIIFSLMIVHIMRLLSYLQAPVLLVGTL